MAEYIKAVVTFIDILGFKEIVETRTPDEIKGIIGFLIQVCDEVTIPDEPPKISEMRYINFSDSVVRTSRIFKQNDRYDVNPTVLHELHALTHIQRSLIQEGVVIRGGLTVGEIFLEDNIIFGPALNRAYYLESKVAKHPRVVIDKAVFRALHFDDALLYDEEFGGRIGNYIKKDESGEYFIDYLVGNIRELIEFDEIVKLPEFAEFSSHRMDPGLLRESLVLHRELIMSNRRKYREDSDKLPKYDWLASYHNQVLEDYGEPLRYCKASPEELRVDMSDTTRSR